MIFILLPPLLFVLLLFSETVMVVLDPPFKFIPAEVAPDGAPLLPKDSDTLLYRKESFLFSKN